MTENQFDFFINISLLGGFLAFGTIVVLLFVENRTMAFEYEFEHAQLKNEKELAEVRALQAQISPHFLFNTLSSFIAMIRLNRSDDVLSGLYALANLLRRKYNSDPLVTIREEITYTKHYLQIQIYRYPDKLSVDFDVDEQVAGLKIPALTVQPLVENVCQHVVERQSTLTRLRVRAKMLSKSLIRLEVMDNGPGIPDEVIEQLKAGCDTTTATSDHGIGLSNVHRRLQLHFGQDYGLSVEKPAEGGNIVTCILPANLPSRKG